MSRIRSIHPTLFSDEAYMGMSVWAKAAWPALWTECDDHGVFEWKPIVLKARIFPADHIDFGQLLVEFERAGCVQRVEIDGKQYGLVRNFRKYQRPKKPTYRVMLPPSFLTYIGLTDNSTPPVPHPDGSGTENSQQMEDEGGSREEEETKQPTLPDSPHCAVADATRTERTDFDELWEGEGIAQARGKARNPKDPARRKYGRAVQSGATPVAIREGWRRYAAQQRELGKYGTEFTAQLATWLDERGWQDVGEAAPNLPIVIEHGATVGPEGGKYAGRVWIKAETPEWDAHNAYRRAKGGTSLPQDKLGGWWVESRWPPGHPASLEIPPFLRREAAETQQ